MDKTELLQRLEAEFIDALASGMTKEQACEVFREFLAKIGSGTVSLSEASAPTVQERSAKER